MINKRELEYLTPYLPYGLKMYYHDGNEYFVENLSGIFSDGVIIEGEYESFPIDHKPILKPMSDLDLTDDCWSPYADEIQEAIDFKCVSYLNYHIFILLVANHYDVFSLIEQGLAVNINTLEN